MWEVVGGSSPRAGFTRGWHSAGRSLRDHPRSRGVYEMSRSKVICAGGSSPLARGLPDYVHEAHRVPGIIPARAGFTRASPATTRTSSDHPRSRGVYDRGPFEEGFRVGSSPLARGLQRPRRAVGYDGGIIPARAGFTASTQVPQEPQQDHPRSRGVYVAAFGTRKFLIGSSPLARGLLSGRSRAAMLSGIIPARAGFTPTPTPRKVHARDHPRSRGVYADVFRNRDSDTGSSPLARGLRPG